MNPVIQRIYEIGIVPVIAFNREEEALPLCRALMAGGLPVAEVTFRTDCAQACIRKIHQELPQMLLGAGTVLTCQQADQALEAGASFIVSPGYDPQVTQHVLDRGGLMMPGTASAGEMQQAMNQGCPALKYFPAEANGGVEMLKNIGSALKEARWICTGGINAQNVNQYLSYDRVLAVGGTWICKSEKIQAGAWDEITAACREAVDTMLGLELEHIGINCGDDQEAMATAQLLGQLLSKEVTHGATSIFVGNREVEVLGKPGRGTRGHIAFRCNNLDRAVYHLSQRGVQFDLESMVTRNGRHIALYLAQEVAGFALHLVQK